MMATVKYKAETFEVNEKASKTSDPSKKTPQCDNDARRRGSPLNSQRDLHETSSPKVGLDNVIVYEEDDGDDFGEFDVDDVDDADAAGTATGAEAAKSLARAADTASSGESGFGTVDDDVETVPPRVNGPMDASPAVTHTYTPLQQQATAPDGFNGQTQDSGSSSSSSSSSSDGKYQSPPPPLPPPPQSIKLPTLQGPRQIIYELGNNNNSDDIANILNDNSSMNSSESGAERAHCCSSCADKLNRCYYSCFCCYSTTSHTNQTPMVWSWLSIFCCCCPILGCISLYFTNRSKKFKMKQKYELAEKYSNYAEKLNIASLVFGVIFYAIGFFMITLVIFMHWRYNHF